MNLGICGLCFVLRYNDGVVGKCIFFLIMYLSVVGKYDCLVELLCKFFFFLVFLEIFFGIVLWLYCFCCFFWLIVFWYVDLIKY